MSKENEALISIITPAYNAEHLIGHTIESVLAQSYLNWELLIVDDCSKDGTCDVVKSYVEKDERIRLIALGKNFGGPAGPRNEGIKRANGEWIAFIDADDIWHPRKLELQMRILYSTEAVFACTGMLDFESVSELKYGEIVDATWDSVSFLQQSVRARIPTSSVIASRNLLLRYPFFENIEYKAVEDYHCWLRLLQETGQCIKVKSPLVYYRIVEGQISGSKIYMMGRVFMVHRNFPGRTFISAVVLTLTHVIGGVYFRFIKRGM